MAGEKRSRPTPDTEDSQQSAKRSAAQPQHTGLQSGVNLIEAGGKTCTHEVAWPSKLPEASQELLPPAKRAGAPAKTFPFSLDPFQQTAINCLEAGTILLIPGYACMHVW